LKISNYILILLFLVSCKRGQDYPMGQFPVAQDQESTKPKKYSAKKIGDTLDVFNDVYVFYNKNIGNVSGRNLTKEGYNLGLKWQCVEFVKRYYYDHLNHKMPNSYGHAKDFFNPALKDNQMNKDRNLVQFTNGSTLKPEVNDLIVFDGTILNQYGHVAIISKVNKNSIEVVQQNVGKESREEFKLGFKNDKWTIGDSNVLGWLRKTD